MIKITTMVAAVLINCLVLGLAVSTTVAAAVRIVTEDNPSGPVRHGIDDLREALVEKGAEFTIVHNLFEGTSVRGRVIEILPVSKSESLDWEKPESYGITIKGSGSNINVSVSGSDAVGLMYGLFELAEQVSMAPGKENAIWRALRATSGSPAIEIRADNFFFTIETPSGLVSEQDLGSPISPWFYDEGFWRGYFNTLARNRFNVCDIHAMYSMETTAFPNILPYFLVNRDRPEASWLKTNPWRNLTMLNRIIDIAEDQGVHVALMNYSMDFPNIDVGDEETQIAHTRWAVSEMLTRCPKLWMFGFRIGESGKSENFYTGENYSSCG